jgi:hypothetical protein
MKLGLSLAMKNVGQVFKQNNMFGSTDVPRSLIRSRWFWRGLRHKVRIRKNGATTRGSIKKGLEFGENGFVIFVERR